MSSTILLKKNPKIEFQFLDNGFQVLDEQTERNSGFYVYSDLQHIELSKTWFPSLAKFLRIFTWIFNGVPFFPDTETYKKAKVIIYLKETKLGVWLTDTSMTDKAKVIKEVLDERKS